MDLRVYYQKLRKTESEIPDDFPIVVSRETPDGGKPGVMTQVPRALAARLITDGKADLAGAKEAAQFLTKSADDWQAALDAVAPPAKKPARRVKATKLIVKD
jgi:hypothetical protein